MSYSSFSASVARVWRYRYLIIIIIIIAPVVNTTSIILGSNKIQNRDILVTAYPRSLGTNAVKMDRDRAYLCKTTSWILHTNYQHHTFSVTV